MAQRAISLETAQQLLSSGMTETFSDFKSKAGKEFAAKLKIVNGEVTFEFV